MLLCSFALFSSMELCAQDNPEAEKASPLEISGSVDLYYKYDFSGNANIPTSFADQQNSVSIGMVDVALSKTVGKASFVGEVAFGPRGQAQSIPNAGADGNSFHIQNLYASYAFTDKISLTAGYMGTFVGYEVISPAGNFNYSTSYLFTNGPFQNAGIKLDYVVSDKFAVMVGLFNDWNVYYDDNGISDFGVQIYFAPVEGWDTYVNFVTGSPSGTEIDLTTGFQVTPDFYLGLNAADFFAPDNAGGFMGAALYAQYSIVENFALGLRGESFSFKDVEENNTTLEGNATTAITVSGNLKSGPLTFIPELRFDSGNEEMYLDRNGLPIKTASQVLLAVVYAF